MMHGTRVRNLRGTRSRPVDPARAPGARAWPALTTELLLALLLAALLVAVSVGFARTPETEVPEVVAVAATDDRAAMARARAYLERIPDGSVQLRLTHTLPEELGVLHTLALHRVDVATFGLNRRLSVDPVRRHFPGLHVLVDPRPGGRGRGRASS